MLPGAREVLGIPPTLPLHLQMIFISSKIQINLTFLYQLYVRNRKSREVEHG